MTINNLKPLTKRGKNVSLLASLTYNNGTKYPEQGRFNFVNPTVDENTGKRPFEVGIARIPQVDLNDGKVIFQKISQLPAPST